MAKGSQSCSLECKLFMNAPTVKQKLNRLMNARWNKTLLETFKYIIYLYIINNTMFACNQNYKIDTRTRNSCAYMIIGILAK